MRVLAGSARGTRLDVPASGPTRPCLAAARGAIFNALAARLEGAAVLDLYAGSGALGIEALSRGAARCVFVERDPATAEMLARNLARARLADRARVIAGDAVAVAVGLPESFDLVFCDPPFRQADAWGDAADAKASAEAARLFAGLAQRLKPGGFLLLRLERHTAPPPFPGGRIERDRRYGRSRVVTYALDVSA